MTQDTGRRAQGAGRTNVGGKSDESPTKISRRRGDGGVGARNTATQIMALLLQRSNGVATLRNDGGACCDASGGHFGRYFATCFCNSQRSNVAALRPATTHNIALLQLGRL